MKTDQSTMHQLGMISLPCPYEENSGPLLSTECTVMTDQSTWHQLGLISVPCPYEENLGP